MRCAVVRRRVEIYLYLLPHAIHDRPTVWRVFLNDTKYIHTLVSEQLCCVIFKKQQKKSSHVDCKKMKRSKVCDYCIEKRSTECDGFSSQSGSKDDTRWRTAFAKFWPWWHRLPRQPSRPVSYLVGTSNKVSRHPCHSTPMHFSLACQISSTTRSIANNFWRGYKISYFS